MKIILEKVEYCDRTLRIRACECGAVPRVSGGSGQDPYDQTFQIVCLNCGKHTFRNAWCITQKTYDKLVDLVVSKWNAGESYEKGYQCRDRAEYDKLFVAW